jgi:glycosyltransferase involved in cell wall biosynthesis
MPSILLLFLGDPSTDRRVQSFDRFFREQGWDVELLQVDLAVTSGPRRFLSYDRLLKRAVLGKRTDVVMACDLYSLGAAVRMNRQGNTKRVIYDAREVYTELPTVAPRPLVRWAWKRYERKYIDAVDLMLVTGPHDADAIRRVHAGIPRTVLVRNLPWTAELNRQRELLLRFGLALHLPTFVYVGGLQRGRGLPQLIRTMESSEAQLLVIGGGVLEGELKALTKECKLDTRVKFAGSVPAPEALELVAACDAGVSLIEPVSMSYALALPSKVFEYMMAGIPVLSSKLLQVLDLFKDEHWIEFVDVNDTADIERGLHALIAKVGDKSRSERERMLAQSRYHFEADAVTFMDILRRTYRLQ